MARKAKLIIEDHPKDYTGHPFITLIEYNGEKFLTIIDNYNKKTVSAYILDSCDIKKVSIVKLLDVVEKWFNDDEKQYPVSIEFARLGLLEEFGSVNQQFTTGYVTRVIGPFPQYDMGRPSKVKKRKKKELPDNIEYVSKF